MYLILGLLPQVLVSQYCTAIQKRAHMQFFMLPASLKMAGLRRLSVLRHWINLTNNAMNRFHKTLGVLHIVELAP